MITKERHPEEVQAFATRGRADEGSIQFPLGAPLLAGFWQGAGSSETGAGQRLCNHANEAGTTRRDASTRP
jgi:hypothetical protein